MHDFNCTSADEMNFELMAERTRYLKENPKGVSEMCKVIEEMRREEREEGMREGIQMGVKQTTKTSALRMLSDGSLSPEKIAEFLGLPLDEVRRLQAEQGA